MLPEPLERALKGQTRSYDIKVVDRMEPIHQLTRTRKVVEGILERRLREFHGIKFFITLKITLTKGIKEYIYEIRYIYKTTYFNSKAEVAIRIGGYR